MNLNMHHIAGHIKIVGTITATQLTGHHLEEINLVASTFCYIAGGIASLAIAYYHFKKRRP